MPLGIFGTIWGIRRLQEPVRLPAQQRLDISGSVLSVVGLGGLLMGLSLVSFPMWGDWFTSVCFLVGAIAFPLVLSRITEDVTTNIFLYGGGMSGTPDALHTFSSGLHQAFIIACVISLVAAAASIPQPSHTALRANAAAARPATSAAEHD